MIHGLNGDVSPFPKVSFIKGDSSFSHKIKLVNREVQMSAKSRQMFGNRPSESARREYRSTSIKENGNDREISSARLPYKKRQNKLSLINCKDDLLKIEYVKQEDKIRRSTIQVILGDISHQNISIVNEDVPKNLKVIENQQKAKAFAQCQKKLRIQQLKMVGIVTVIDPFIFLWTLKEMKILSEPIELISLGGIKKGMQSEKVLSKQLDKALIRQLSHGHNACIQLQINNIDINGDIYDSQNNYQGNVFDLQEKKVLSERYFQQQQQSQQQSFDNTSDISSKNKIYFYDHLLKEITSLKDLKIEPNKLPILIISVVSLHCLSLGGTMGESLSKEWTQFQSKFQQNEEQYLQKRFERQNFKLKEYSPSKSTERPYFQTQYQKLGFQIEKYEPAYQEGKPPLRKSNKIIKSNRRELSQDLGKRTFVPYSKQQELQWSDSGSEDSSHCKEEDEVEEEEEQQQSQSKQQYQLQQQQQQQSSQHQIEEEIQSKQGKSASLKDASLLVANKRDRNSGIKLKEYYHPGFNDISIKQRSCSLIDAKNFNQSISSEKDNSTLSLCSNLRPQQWQQKQQQEIIFQGTKSPGESMFRNSNNINGSNKLYKIEFQNKKEKRGVIYERLNIRLKDNLVLTSNLKNSLITNNCDTDHTKPLHFNNIVNSSEKIIYGMKGSLKRKINRNIQDSIKDQNLLTQQVMEAACLGSYKNLKEILWRETFLDYNQTELDGMLEVFIKLVSPSIQELKEIALQFDNVKSRIEYLFDVYLVASDTALAEEYTTLRRLKNLGLLLPALQFFFSEQQQLGNELKEYRPRAMNCVEGVRWREFVQVKSRLIDNKWNKEDKGSFILYLVNPRNEQTLPIKTVQKVLFDRIRDADTRQITLMKQFIFAERHLKEGKVQMARLIDCIQKEFFIKISDILKHFLYEL